MAKKIDSLQIQRTIWAKLYYVTFICVKVVGGLIAVAFVIWAIIAEALSFRDEPKLLKTTYSSTLKDYKIPTLYLTARFTRNKHVERYDANLVLLPRGRFSNETIDCKNSPDAVFHKFENSEVVCWKLSYLLDEDAKDSLDMHGILVVVLDMYFKSEQDKKEYFSLSDLEKGIVSVFSPGLNIHFEYEGVDFQIGNTYMLKGAEAHNFQILEQIEVEDSYHGTHNVSMNTKFYPFGSGMADLKVEAQSKDGNPVVRSMTVVNIAYASFNRVYNQFGRSPIGMMLSGIGAKFSMAKMISGIILLVINVLLIKGYSDNTTYNEALVHKKVILYLKKYSKGPKGAGEVDHSLHDLLISEETT